ncbi:putative galacturonosyltransferase 7 isoform X2 [Primulina tabacum]|uniref:putative galacturonosyltransferase 7 isoform X2 n=1 Tax=Primulina tabacum TaxID=48773 RepID=UPI003F5A6DA2
MKGVVGGSAKRRWRNLVIPVVGLVVLSMLVPLVFLLGLHSGSHSTGDATHQRNSQPNPLRPIDQDNDAGKREKSEVHQSKHVNDLLERLSPSFPKEFGNNSKRGGNETGFSMPADLPKQAQPVIDTGPVAKNYTGEHRRSADESDLICEFRFGSYCLWGREHKEKMEDAVVKRMKDLLFVARAYYPSIAKLPSFEKLSHEMKQNIQEFERVLSETTTDKDLPPGNEKKIPEMEAVIAKAKSCPVDCNNVDKKFRQLVDMTEDESNFHMKQSAFLYQLAAQTMPKSLHCLSMRLTVEFFRSSFDTETVLMEKFLNPDLYHYIVFSTNILASSVVINSTVMHAKESEKQVFHLLTDRENYFAMKFWYFRNKYKEASVQVLNIEDIKLFDHHKVAPMHLSLPEEYRVSFHRVDELSFSLSRTEYISMFSHSHYLLPKIFRSLEKVVVLEDDVVVQSDLSALWDIDMGEKVNGAVQLCAVKLSQMKNYFSRNTIYENSCAWTSGLNVIDLSRWRAHNISETFQRLVQEMSREEGTSETTALSASLLTFQGLVYSLDGSWMLAGLGRNYGIDLEAVNSAAMLHFDGNMKPWLELGIPEYRSFWKMFLNQQDSFLNDCNVIQ